MIKVIALAHALAHAGEHTVAAMLLRHVAYKLLHEHSFPHACASKEPDFASANEWSKQIYGLKSGFEYFRARGLIFERGRLSVDGQSRSGGNTFLACLRRKTIYRLADDVEKPPEHQLAYGNSYGGSCVRNFRAARESGRVHESNAPHSPKSHMLYNFENDGAVILALRSLAEGGQNLQRIPDLGQMFTLEVNVDDRTDYLLDCAFIHIVPEIISETSRVMADWRALLNFNVRLCAISSDLSEADFIATMRALCSDACDSSRAW